MSPKKLAALLLTSCLMSTVGCSSTGGGLFGGGSSGGCGHGCGLFGRNNNSAPAAIASAPTSYVGGAPVTDCPCSYNGNTAGIFQPAVMTQGVPATSGGSIMGDVQQMPIQQMPVQQTQPTFPGPVTTPAVPMAPPMGNPGPAPVPGNPPRIQPIPAAPGGMPPAGAPMGVAPMGGPAPAGPGGFAAPVPWGQ